MQVRAVAKYVKIQPRKVRIIADEIRGMDAVFATHKLRHHTSKSAAALRKVIVSAMANAAENHELEASTLKIAEIRVDEGPRQKRMQARAMGRGNRIVKKTAHITVVVADQEGVEPVKPHGTRPKARPTLAAKPVRAPRNLAPTAAPTIAPAVTFAPAPVQDESGNGEQVTGNGEVDQLVDNAPVGSEVPEASGTVETTDVAVQNAPVTEGNDPASTADDAVEPATPVVNEAEEADEAKQEEQS